MRGPDSNLRPSDSPISQALTHSATSTGFKHDNAHSLLTYAYTLTNPRRILVTLSARLGNDTYQICKSLVLFHPGFEPLTIHPRSQWSS